MRVSGMVLLLLFLCAGARAADESDPDELTTEERPAGIAPENTPSSSPAAIVPPVLVEPPTLTHPLPAEEARALGPARVVVVVTVGVDGAVSDLAIVEGSSHADPRLRDAALQAAHTARFQPATRDGAPVVVRLPFELTFEPPPAPEPPFVDGVALSAEAALSPSSAPPFDFPALGQSLAVGGALVLGASLLFTTFSGVTALDNAARQEELAKTPADVTAAETTRAFGTTLLIPFAGPFIALASAPDASTSLFTGLGGVAHLAGAGLLVAGGALLLAPLFLDPSAPPQAAE